MNTDFKKFTTSDGENLCYFDEGDKNAPIVIMIAGFATAGITWSAQVDALVENGYRAVVFDRRCHGATGYIEKGQDMITHGRDLKELIEHLGRDKVFLLGQSQGACTIWSYLGQFGSDKVRSVICIDQPLYMLNTEDWPYGAPDLNADTFDTYFTKPFPKPNAVPYDRRVIDFIKTNTNLMGVLEPKLTYKLVTDNASRDWRKFVTEITAPMLFVAGEKSPYFSPDHAKANSEYIKNSEVFVLKDAGHSLNMELPDEFNKVMFEYFERF